MSEKDRPIDPEVQQMLDSIDAELSKLTPEERRARLLTKLELPADASDEDLDAAMQAFVMSYVTRMSPEQLAVWEGEMKESPLFLHALTARDEDGEIPTDEELDQALAELDGLGCFGPSRMTVEVLVDRLVENNGSLNFQAVIPAIADTHKDSAPFEISSSVLADQDIVALKQRAGQDGSINPPAIFIGAANQTDRALFATWTQKDFDSFDLRDLLMMPRTIKL
jgi:hypothetical protein